MAFFGRLETKVAIVVVALVALTLGAPRILVLAQALDLTPTQSSASLAEPARTNTPTGTATPSSTATNTTSATNTATTTATPGGVLTVYSDSLAPGWKSKTWGATVNLASTAYLHSGINAISYTITARNGAFSPYRPGPPIDTSPYTNIRFWVNGQATGGQLLAFMVRFASTQTWGPHVRITPYVAGGGVVAGQWRLVDIPLSALGATNTLVNRIALQDVSGTTGSSISVDDIEFYSAIRPTATPTTTMTSSPTLTATPTATWNGSSTSTATPGLSPTSTPTDTPSASPSVASTASPSNTPALTATPTTVPSGSVPAFNHAYILVMENVAYDHIVGSSSAPYINSLIAQYGLATNYYAVSHPSEPDYLALFSGSTQGVTDDGIHNLSATNLADQLEATGKTWRMFAENVPPGCYAGSTASGGADGPGNYARKHEPAISFTDISGNSARCANITDFSHFDAAAADFTFIAPNMCNDMHDCTIAVGDAWLQSWLPSHILNTAAWASGKNVLFIVWDEGKTQVLGGGHVAALVVSNAIVSAGFQSGTLHNHYSVARTLEDAWGLGCNQNACAANNLGEFFK